MPETLPDRLEAGTPNMPGISGLLEGLKFLACRGPAHILRHEQMLLRRMIEGLRQIPDICLYAAEEPERQTGVLSMELADIDCETVAAALAEREIGVRAGLHCAPLAHRAAGTEESGTVRLSFSAFNTAGEIDRFLCMFEQIAKKLRKSKRMLI